MSDWESEEGFVYSVPHTTFVNSALQPTSQNPPAGGYNTTKTADSTFNQDTREERKFVPSRGGLGSYRLSPSRDPYEQTAGVGARPSQSSGELRGLSRGRNNSFQNADSASVGFSSEKGTTSEASGQAEETQRMQIPTNMLGRIIGKKGAKIQELERESGCSIKAPKQSEQVDGEYQSLTITGLSEQINRATAMIEELVLSTTYQRPNTVGFGNFSEDGGRGDREGRGGFQGRSFRGQDNNEVRKPRGFGDREDSRPKTGFSSSNNSGFGDREDSRTRSGFGDREDTRQRSGFSSSNNSGFGDREDTRQRSGFSSSNNSGFGDREDTRQRSGFSSSNNSGFGDREDTRQRSGFSRSNNSGFGDREDTRQRPGFSSSNNSGFGDREDTRQRPGFGDREDTRQRPGFGDREDTRQRSGFGDKEDSRTRSGFSSTNSGFGDRQDNRQRSGYGDRSGFSNSNNFDTQQHNSETTTPSAPRINWSKINADREANIASKFEGLRTVRKDFYEEDPMVAAMTESQVDLIRKENMGLIAHDLSDLNRKIPNPVLTFEQAFQHYPDILEQIYLQKFVEPTPIQKQAWPIALLGYDMVGIAQTGTGKTLAFLLPGMIHMAGQTLFEGDDGPGMLVVCPTRELALQTDSEVKKFKFRGFGSVCVYGGGDRSLQVQELRKGAKIVIGTPGRLHDLQMSGDLILKSVSFFVLDEADRMLDMGFEPQILKLVIDIRPDRQTMMTSATWPRDVRRLADSYLKKPFQVYVGSLDLKACHSVSQTIEIMDGNVKKDRTYEFLDKMGVDDKVLIFTSRKATADDVASDFFIRGIDAQSIHGDRAQEDREQALDDFKTGRVKILVATDVASRGLDIPNVTYVVNFDFPIHIEDYVHRIGRTGRAGKTGKSLTFFTRENWRWAQPLIEILEEAQQEVPEELFEMAKRFKSRQERDKREGRSGGGGRGGRGGGGRYSKKDNDKFSCFV